MQVAIEQLQQELAASRREEESIKEEARKASSRKLRAHIRTRAMCVDLPCTASNPGQSVIAGTPPAARNTLQNTFQPSTSCLLQAYEDQSAQCRAVQQQLQLCEDELAQRSQDLERCQADASALQVISSCTIKQCKCRRILGLGIGRQQPLACSS